MINQNFWSALMVSFIVMGCSFPDHLGSAHQSDRSQVNPMTPSPSSNLNPTRDFPAYAMMGGKKINLEVAQTPAQQEMGLMYRQTIGDDQGMLFLFNPAKKVSFWMKNCYIHLDMVFLLKGKIVAIANNVPPCTQEPCPVYPSGSPIDQVIELGGGRSSQLGLNLGDSVSVEFLPQ